MEDVKIGDKVRCKVTKIEGVVCVRHDYLYGMANIGFRPEGSHQGKPHEMIHIDIAQAELVKSGVVSRDGLIPNKKVRLGDMCKDTISGFEGICTGIAEWLYSCSKVHVTPQKINEKTHKPVAGHWFDEPQVEVKQEQVMTKTQNETGCPDKPVSSNHMGYSK